MKIRCGGLKGIDMAGIPTFPLLASLDKHESLGLMLLIEYISGLQRNLEPLIRQAGCLEEEILSDACMAVRKISIACDVTAYGMEGVKLNTLQQYLGHVKNLPETSQINIINTWYDAPELVHELKLSLPYNHEVIVGMAMDNIIVAKRRTVREEFSLNFELQKDLDNKLVVASKLINKYIIYIGD